MLKSFHILLTTAHLLQLGMLLALDIPSSSKLIAPSYLWNAPSNYYDQGLSIEDKQLQLGLSSVAQKEGGLSGREQQED